MRGELWYIWVKSRRPELADVVRAGVSDDFDEIIPDNFVGIMQPDPDELINTVPMED
jgi:hypothetical protein